MTAIKTLLWSIFVPSGVTILTPYLLLTSRYGSWRINLLAFRFVGVIPILLGVAIYIWCACEFTFTGRGTPAPFDPPKQLVIKGPYLFVRNPMYVFVALTLIGEAIVFGAVILVVYAVIAITVCHVWVLLYEEPGLRRRFGEPYKRYCESVSRWIPGLPHRHGANTGSQSRAVT